MKKHSEYIFVQPQIVGSLGDYEYTYNSNAEYYRSFFEAKKEGLDYFDHDDFWVAELECSKDQKKVVALYHLDGEKRDDPEAIRGVNEEFCF